VADEHSRRERARSVGVEEEFVLLDPGILTPVDRAPAVLADLRDGEVPGSVMAEFYASQIELASPPLVRMTELAESLRLSRKALVAAAGGECVAAASGTPFSLDRRSAVTDAERYRRIASEFGAVARDHQINGMHVHVSVESGDEAIEAMNRMRPWLPVLVAMSANSPFWNGADTGFDSWRTVHTRRWSTSGIPPHFADADDYRARCEALSGIAGIVDAGTLNWCVRPSATYPTIEVRIFDVQLDTEASTALAAITRALVSESDRPDTRTETPSPEMLDAALWHAARHGVTDTLVHPVTAALEPASTVLDALLERSRRALEQNDDWERVRAFVDRVVTDGNGAQRQRRAFETGGPAGLRRLLSQSR